MSALYPQNWTTYLAVLTVFFRLLGMFLLVPVFSHRAVPGLVKVLMAFSLSLALFPVVAPYLSAVELTLGGLVLRVVQETAVGLLMGFVAYVTFEAVHLAAQFIGYQMGLGTVGLIDPQTSAQTSVLVPLHGILALMVFLMADFHHHLLALFVRSFEVTGLLNPEALVGKPVVSLMLGFVGKLFTLGVRMALPVTFVILACNVAIGILARMLPQMQIILFAFPITILVGMTTIYVLAPELLGAMESLLGEMSSDMMGLLRTI